MIRLRFLLFLLFLLCFSSVEAQQKAAQLAHIRQQYAWAQSQSAQNGKGTNPNNSIVIKSHDVSNDDMEILFETETSLFFQYVDEKPQLYFVVDKAYANGHYVYSEHLYEPSNGQLIFAYKRTETHAGFVFEERYYWNNGKLIEIKATAERTEQDAKDFYDSSETYPRLFSLLMSPARSGQEKGRLVPSATKTEQLKQIRGAYAAAKADAEKDRKSEMRHNIWIEINYQPHDFAPITRTLDIYFKWNQQEEKNHCYLIEEKAKSMYFQRYYEYLFDSSHHGLIFSYQHEGDEAGEFESRYYFNPAGECFEAKTNDPDTDYGRSNLKRAKSYLDILELVL